MYVLTEEAVYRIVSATQPPPLLYPASAVAPYRTKGGKFTPFFRNIFNDNPQFFARFR